MRSTRWAAIFSGVWMLAILIALSGLVGNVAMPSLGAILIFAAVSSVKPDEIRMALRTGPSPTIAMVTTFLATLFLPIAAAVGIGVALSLLLQLNREAIDLTLVELAPQPDGQFAERPAPTSLVGHEVTLLDVYGSLYYAGARTLASLLPNPQGAAAPVVVLRLRGRTALGVTSYKILTTYAAQLDEVGGRLMLSGVAPDLLAQLRRAEQRRRRGSRGVPAEQHPRRVERRGVRGGASLARVACRRTTGVGTCWLRWPYEADPESMARV